MKVLVAYMSLTGNTKKIAKAIFLEIQAVPVRVFAREIMERIKI